MAETQGSWVELLKYPVAIFSVLIALIIGRHALGISFGAVSEISADGVKFSQEAKGELTDLASKLNGALAAIEELKKHPQFAQDGSTGIEAAVTEAAQTVSDQTAQFSRLPQDTNGGASPQGYIWIGNYRNGWSAVKLASLETGQAITAVPQRLQPGTVYQVLGNMVVRDGLPADDASYYQGRRSLGTVPRGTRVRLVGAPVGIDRGFAVQYWAQVELAQLD